MFEIGVALTIGFIPGLPSGDGVRAGVAVGGSLTLDTSGPKVGVSLGLGMSAVEGRAKRKDCSPKLKQIGSFKCMKSVAASFTLFCKEIDFATGDNDAPKDDPCATSGRAYKEHQRRRRKRQQEMRRRGFDMPGTGRSVEKSVDQCRERCKRVSRCKHYSYWSDGGCHLQSKHSTLVTRSRAKSGPPVCCAVEKVWWAIDKNRRRRQDHARNKKPKDVKLDMNRRGRSSEETLLQCQERCRRVRGCKHYTYWSNGGCHITDSSAKRYIFEGKSPQASGPPYCS